MILNFLSSKISIKESGTLLKNCDIYALTLTDGSKNICFRCSAKILPLPLKDIADKLQIPQKLEIDHNSINLENYNNTDVRERVIEYCRRDVQITQNFMFKINEEINSFYPGWWIWIYTISGLALKIFDRNFNSYIKLKNNSRLDDIIRPAYYGGRCEVFGNPRDDDLIFHYDFSSMYTNMLKEEFPYGSYSIIEKPANLNIDGFYFIKVRSEVGDIPILPYRCKKTNKLIFPNGTFSGLYWKEEIDLFIRNGGVILEVLYCVTFENKGFLFKDFSDFCIKNRNRSALNKVLWKLIPNSFIGRLGLKPKSEKTIIIKASEYRPWEYDVISDKKINDQVLVRVRSNDNNDLVSNNVIYPSIITSKARILWWNTAKEVIKNGGRILYCDTDSIFVAFKRNVLGEKHGSIEWRDNNKDTIIDKACFAGNKAYFLKVGNRDIVKIKGTKNNNISLEDFENIFYSSDRMRIKYEFFNKKSMNIRIEEIIKILNFSFYDKREFDDSKKTSKPLIINEDTLCSE